MKIQQRGFLNKYFMLTIFYLFSFITFLSFPLIHKVIILPGYLCLAKFLQLLHNKFYLPVFFFHFFM